MDLVDKSYDEFKKKTLDVLQKYPSLTGFDYIEQCKLDLENFKKYGVFKNPHNETTQSGNVLPVKLERISESSPLTEIISTERVNVENNNDMPPPTEPLKRNRRKQTQVKVEAARITRSKIKEEPKRSTRNRKTETDKNRDSDVVLQSQEIDIISLSDTEDELNNDVDSNRSEILQNNPNVKEILQTRNTRSTRSTKIKENCDKIEENQKRTRSPSTEDYSEENLKPKPRRTKRVKSDELSDPESSVQINSTSEKGSKVNDVIEVIEVTSKQAALANETVVISGKVINKVPMNETVVIEKARVIMDKTVVLRKESPVLSTARENNYDDAMTEDESQEDETPVKHNKYKQNAIKNNKPKAVFNNIENSPVKRHMEAFEKPAEVDSENQNKIKSKLNKKQLEVAEGHLTRSAKGKTKHVFTPILDRNKTKLVTSTIVLSSESKYMSTKSASALKASHQEYTERELKRKEKETEAQRKKEALLQAQIEERRRKREEKQLKAQQTREALVKEKQKTLEYSEKMKEEKYKQVLAEKQEKLAKQREEAEKRRLLATKKALEEKCKEKERRNAIEGDLQTKPTNKPKYLTMKTPLLPSAHCYDSDDERSQSDVEKPEWAEWINLRLSLMHMHYAGDKIKNTFFVCEATTPDLQDIFEYIDPRKLKRTSSAIWTKPPRFTLMPTYFE